MAYLLTAEQMRSVEEAAMASGDVTGHALMERAGEGVLAAILAHWPDLERQPGQAFVLCGPGNNGGDGFVVARLLHARGWSVVVQCLGDPERLPPDALANYTALPDGVTVQAYHTTDARELRISVADWGAGALVVDAGFGIGLTRPVTGLGDIADLSADAASDGQRKDRAHIVAIDLPSGICADSGRRLSDELAPAPAIMADLTVTFQHEKPGHVLGDGALACGVVRVQDIGLSPLTPGTRSWDAVVGGSGLPSLEHAVLTEVTDTGLSQRLRKPLTAHKYDHGHALILSGPPGQGGAARLAARGALRVGAGLVTVGCPMRAVSEHAAHLNAIMVTGLDGTAGLEEKLEDKRLNAVCLGPGLGLGPATGDLVKRALAARRGTVLDADALSRFQRQPAVLFEMLHELCVMTPHAGEFARLFPDIAEQLVGEASNGPAFAKTDAAKAAAARAGSVIVFKGADTVIATPDGRCAIHPGGVRHAAPWLATAGSGDVLAGMITGLLARGLSPFDAAQSAVWLHAEAARLTGPALVAEDIPEAMPAVFSALGV